MKKLVTTQDGSHTLYHEKLGEHYHSINGAIQESRHIFIEAGLHQLRKKNLQILEVGLGTGLNAFLTLIDAIETLRVIQYTSYELFPLSASEAETLNYPDFLSYKNYFLEIHNTAWEQWQVLNRNFSLLKINSDITRSFINGKYDLIYYDAFSPEVQPELWTEELFKKIGNAMIRDGILTTYSAKGIVKRNLEQAGFEVTRIPGPPGKREIIRAVKL